MNKMEKGIIIIGAGDPYYGRLAINNAASIRSHDANIPILIYTTAGCIPSSVMETVHKSNITIDLLPEESYIAEGKVNYFRPKTYLYALSPFEKTICLDADMLWLPSIKPERVFKELEGSKFSCSNEGFVDVKTGVSNTTRWYQFWADYDEIIGAYGVRLKEKFYQLRTEFIYFEKCKEAKRLFGVAQKIYDEKKLSYSSIAGVVPDELAFNIASSVLGLYPHKDRWCPAYWWFRRYMMREGNMNVFEIQFKFPLLSIGGNKQQEYVLTFYNQRAEGYTKKIGLRGYKAIHNKAEVLPERKRI
ncbi:MAG TPA: hypothetical protein PLD84_13690 [Chitinophagales bacterium]|nr:hypothetical protein [Chitinophagales bacterium]